ncbi:hypothetical protein L873DRAFT_1676620 [Choiromyces venosus 120613-1]|uniref:Uncharacterized protein n=1 Tax=Choiromyces venosus 120613-1 TaxID=1336337 RepID=A0A3N4JZ51_9PEZI|nr:hypothetical protein L873DRAFT_1676620 [Choiromyces venosus 120613-1]
MAFTTLADSLLPFDSVKVGRLVLDPKSPQDDYLDQPNEPKITHQDQQNFQIIQNSRRYSSLKARILKLFNAYRDTQQASHAVLSSNKARTYRLQNSGEWFRDACKTDETRKWMERSIEDGAAVYLVIGIHTVFDAAVRESTGVSRDVDGDPGRAPQPANSGNVLTESLVRDRRTEDRHHVALGEQIYAVQYRKVDFRSFSSKRLDKITLEHGNIWKVFWGVRGHSDASGDEDDVIEAFLADESPQGDFEESCTVGDDNEYFIF